MSNLEILSNPAARTKLRKAIGKLVKAEVRHSWKGVESPSDFPAIERELKEARNYLTRVIRELLP